MAVSETLRAKLSSVISKKNEKFNDIYLSFKKTFPSTDERLEALNNLLQMFSESLLPPDKLFPSIYILLQNHHFGACTPPIENPFTDTLINIVESKNKGFIRGGKFIVDLILFSDKYKEETPLKLTIIDRDQETFGISAEEFREKLEPVKNLSSQNIKNLRNILDPLWKLQIENKNKTKIQPNFSDVFPPVDDSEDEFEWIIPCAAHSLIWEDKIENKPIPALMKVESILRQKIEKNAPLLPSEEHFVMKTFREEAISNHSNRGILIENLIQHYIKVDNLPKVLSISPSLLSSALIYLAASCPSSYSLYLDNLVSLQPSLKVLKTLRELSKDVKLPQKPLLKCIQKTAYFCGENKRNDAVKTLVKDFCGFVNLLIKDQPSFKKDLRVELQSFCISFNSVKEAIVLFKSLNSE